MLLGASIGLMHATKETCVIALAAMAAAAVAAALPEMWRPGFRLRDLKAFVAGLRGVPLARLGLAAVIMVNTAVAVSALFFSAFFTNARGVVDSYTAFWHYVARASGEGSAGPQVQPWDYYFRVLFATGDSTGPIFDELTIAVLALVGLVAAAFGRGMKPEHRYAARFVAVYTVLMAVVYSAMPYKTPWSVLGMLHGMILLAGVGAAALWRAAPRRWLGAVVLVVLAAGVGHLGWQAHRTSFQMREYSGNPYVHTPTSRSALRLADKVREVADSHPDGRAMPVQVICPDNDFWPLPWYLRDMPRIRWLKKVPEGPAAPLIITRPELTAAIVKYAYEDQPKGERHLIRPFPLDGGTDWLLRAGVPLEVIIRHELLEAYRAKQDADPQLPVPQPEETRP